MKVMEVATDRRAEAHIYVDGKLDALKEYGEYTDVKDKAICCYIIVEEGQTLKINGRFNGTTYMVAYDAVVDGVLRKASTYRPKTVITHKNKKLDMDTFLYRTDEGVVDTEMCVAQMSGTTPSRGEAAETIGTLELRLFVTRQFNVFHAVGSIENYYTSNSNIRDTDSRVAHYKHIIPTFQMSFETNAATLEKNKERIEQGRVDAARPGNEPWAIFRFHYRSRDAIIGRNMKITFDSTSKAKTEPHTLVFDPVPPLLLGSKPNKDDDDTSTRASSPFLSDVFSASISSSREASIPKSSMSTKNPQPDTTALRKSISENQLVMSNDTATTVLGENHARAIKGSVERPLAKPRTFTASNMVTNQCKSDAHVLASTGNEDNSSVLDRVRDTSKGNPAESRATASKGATQNPTNNANKPAERDQVIRKDSGASAASKTGTDGPTSVDPAKVHSPIDHSLQVRNSTTTGDANSPKDNIHKMPQFVLSSPLNSVVEATPIAMIESTAPKKPMAPTMAVTPAKRPNCSSNNDTPKVKHTKLVPVTPIPSKVQRGTLGSPSPKPMSIERQVAEQRKRLEELRKKREEIAKKQAHVDEQMTPYKQRMAEELERLNREMMDEKTAFEEEEEHYSFSVEMLSEFKTGDSGN